MIELTQEEKEQANRIVNGNIMCASLMVLKENLEYFRGTYKGSEKNVFNRILTNCNILFDPKKMSKEELQEVETISDALIDSEYDVKKQYRKHVSNQIINSRA